MSGQLKDYPADAEVENLLVECKVRAVRVSAKGARTLTLDLDWLKGVQKLAEAGGYEQGIVVARPKGSPELVVVCSYAWLLALLERLYTK